jgi:ABC-type multidrug transport system ATPase subunit
MLKLICRDLEYRYPQNPNFRLLLTGLSCELNGPLGVYGLTGSGKTTFGKILGGLLTPLNGFFKIESSATDSLDHDRAPKILYLPQFPESIFLGMRIEQALQVMSRDQSDPNALTAVFRENLHKFDLDFATIGTRFGYELSAGELRLATIALGLSVAADLTVFDEPTIALSQKARKNFYEVASEYATHKGLLIISHDYQLVRKLCRKILIFAQGAAIFNGTWEELALQPSVVRKVGLDLTGALM